MKMSSDLKKRIKQLEQRAEDKGKPYVVSTMEDLLALAVQQGLDEDIHRGTHTTIPENHTYSPFLQQLFDKLQEEGEP